MVKLENKVQLRQLLNYLFKATAHLKQTELIYCEGHVAENLTSGKEEKGFAFQQAQVDMTILSAYAKLRESYNRTVIIVFKDTDVYVQDPYVARNLLGDLLIKNKSTLFKFIDLVSSNIANVLTQFHVITGFDRTSGFEKLQNDQEAQHLLCKLGEYLELSDDVRDDMRQFVPFKMYGRKEFGSSFLFIFPPKALRSESSSLSYRAWLGKYQGKMSSCSICNPSQS